MKSVLSEAEILKRKSKNVNEIIDRAAQAEALDHLRKVKREDKRVTKQIDVKIITDKTIETLLQYLQLLPEDNKYTLDKKLNEKRRNNAGVKPNKFLKTININKADIVDHDSDSDGSPKTNRENKTAKSEKTNQSEEEDDGKSTQN